MKNQRVLDIYLRLLNNQAVNTKKLALEYQVSERSIQRDIHDLRNFLLSTNDIAEIVYSNNNSYILKNEKNQKLTNSEILAVCKILLDSRAFLKAEMEEIISKLIKQCVPKESYLKVSKLIENEKFHYIELQHKKSYINDLWELGEAIQHQFKVEVEYIKVTKEEVKRVIQPVGLMFSEYYFYLLAYIDDKNKELKGKFPTIYRIDRIKKFRILDEHFPIIYKNRFEEGEFRKRVQFMTIGELKKIIFECSEQNLEAILDRLPTAKIQSKEEDRYVITAEVFGLGIDRWLAGQGKDIKIIEKK